MGSTLPVAGLGQWQVKAVQINRLCVDAQRQGCGASSEKSRRASGKLSRVVHLYQSAQIGSAMCVSEQTRIERKQTLQLLCICASADANVSVKARSCCR